METEHKEKYISSLCKRNKPHMHSRYLDRKGATDTERSGGKFLPKLE